MTITTSRPCAHRGFAMLLVLISLAVATILATSYLASRDTSLLIGENISAGSSARSAALATINAGVAILETETDWRNGHTSGVVFTNAALAGASVDLKFMDLTTGAPPTDDTTDVEITATAAVDGVEETVVAHAFVPLADPDPDLDLSEFVVFAKDRLRVEDTSLIARWVNSPHAALKRGLAIGTLNTTAGAIELSDYAVAIDGTAYSSPGASSLIVSNSGPGKLRVIGLPDTVLVPAPPSPPLSLALLSTGDLLRNGAHVTISADRRVNKLTMRNGSVLSLQGPMTLIADDTVTIELGGKINVSGAVTIIAMKNVEIKSDARIELQDGATLTAHIADAFTLQNADVDAVGATRDATGDAGWIDPARVTFFEYNPSGMMPWRLDVGAVFKGSIYAPSNSVELSGGSAIYGRVTAFEVTVHNGSAIYYDHGLDTRNGYIPEESPIYDDDDEVDPIIETNATSLDPVTLTLVNTLLKASRVSIAPVVGVNDPTPRTVDVTYEIVSMSSPTASWESKGEMIPGEE